jgi:phosphoglycolate phosphatase
MNIFFDLDGTLLDSKERLFRLFSDITKQSILNFDDYWELKRAMYDHRKILRDFLHYSFDRIDSFEKQWMLLIESDEYLLFDRPFSFTVLVLQNLTAKGFNLYVITARQDKLRTMQQLDNNGLTSYFSKVLITETTKSKTKLILESGVCLVQNDLFVGDTGIDIKTAKEIGIRSMAVLSGFRNKSVLLKYKPDYIENDIQAVLKYL